MVLNQKLDYWKLICGSKSEGPVISEPPVSGFAITLLRIRIQLRIPNIYQRFKEFSEKSSYYLMIYYRFDDICLSMTSKMSR
jgi:hypothetical protein